MNDIDLTVTDLRSFAADNVLEWQVPDGNWNIEEYVCEPDMNAHVINTLDYDISLDFIRSTFGRLTESFSDEREDRISLFIYRNIMFAGQNRRMWDEHFNECFEEEYGFDPAPYYTLMFRDFGGSSRRYKCMLMSCRARMLR